MAVDNNNDTVLAPNIAFHTEKVVNVYRTNERFYDEERKALNSGCFKIPLRKGATVDLGRGAFEVWSSKTCLSKRLPLNI